MTEQFQTPEEFIEAYRALHPMDAHAFDNPDEAPPWLKPGDQADASILWRLREALDERWPNPWNAANCGDAAKEGEQKANAAEAVAPFITAPLTSIVSNIPHQPVPDTRDMFTDAIEDLEVNIALALWGEEQGLLEAVEARLASMNQDITTAARSSANGDTFLEILERTDPATAEALRRNATNLLNADPPPQDPTPIVHAFTKATQGLSPDTKWTAAYQIAGALAAKPARAARKRHDRLKDNESFKDVEQLMNISQKATDALTNGDLPSFTQQIQLFIRFTTSNTD